MNYQKYLKSWDGALQENRFTRWIIAGLLLANLILLGAVMGKDETVVVVPSTLASAEKVGQSNATGGYKEAWGMQVALLVGNVTPQTAGYVSEHLGTLAAPSVYQPLMAEVQAQAKRLKEEQVTIQFTPLNVFHVAEQDVVVVSGQYVVRGVRNEEKSEIRTYEVGIEIQNYAAVIRSLKSYTGPWVPPAPTSA